MASSQAASQRVRQPRHKQNQLRVPAVSPEIMRWGLLLAAVTIICYLPVLRGGFIWDDVTVVHNPLLATGSGLARIWFQPTAHTLEDHYWPLVYTTFWIERQLWGLWAPGYHLTNLAFHTGNTLLVWLIMRRLQVPGAWLAAALFGVHPVHAESVAWVIERKDVLSALFYLLAALAYLRFDETKDRRLYGLAMGSFVCGMLSKSVVVTFPAALLVILYWKHGKISRRELLPLLPFLGVGLLIALADMIFVGRVSNAASDLDWIQRVLIAGRAFWFYMEKLVWPAELIALYPRWEISTGRPLQYLFPVAAVALLAALWLLRRRIGRGPVAAALFYAITLSPTLGVIDFSFMRLSFVADRYQYLASIGPLALAAAVMAKGAGNLHLQRHAAVLAGFVILTLSMLTWRQSRVYSDSETFWRHTLRYNSSAWEARHQLGLALAEKGNFEEGIAQIRKAVEIRPDYAEAYSNLGVLLAQTGDLAGAARQFEEALRHRPDLPDAQRNLVRARQLMSSPQ